MSFIDNYQYHIKEASCDICRAEIEFSSLFLKKCRKIIWELNQKLSNQRKIPWDQWDENKKKQNREDKELSYIYIKRVNDLVNKQGICTCFVLEAIDYGEQELVICKKHLQEIIDKMEEIECR